MQLIDTHCHLTHEYDTKTPEILVQEAKAAGVITLITIGTELENLKKVAEISDRFPEVYHTVGVHPHEAGTLEQGYLEALRTAAAHPKCRAIGEIGLDFHYDHSPKSVQIARFKEQLELAASLDMPVVIHCREAEDEMVRCLKGYVSAMKPDSIPGVIHCFSGSQQFGHECLDLGFYISLSGIITFKKADDLRLATLSYPIERLLVETDSPYLAPVPFRGKKCEPSMVVHTAKKLAEIKKVSESEIARITTENAKKVFKI